MPSRTPDEKLSALGLEVRGFERRTGVSQKAIAKACGVDYSFFRDVLQGNRPGLSVQPKLRHFMDGYTALSAQIKSNDEGRS